MATECHFRHTPRHYETTQAGLLLSDHAHLLHASTCFAAAPGLKRLYSITPYNRIPVEPVALPRVLRLRPV